jgi:diacylglycerol kinase (ATP)
MKRMYNSVVKCTLSFGYAFKGIRYALQNENNFIYHLLATATIAIIGWILGFSNTEWLLVILLVGLVYTAELFNSAIEKLVDLTTPHYDDRAGAVKDIAAGAVLVISITALVIGLIIIIGHL